MPPDELSRSDLSAGLDADRLGEPDAPDGSGAPTARPELDAPADPDGLDTPAALNAPAAPRHAESGAPPGPGRESTSGLLLLAATPLGNPGDASARLVEALGTADILAAEDTRRVRTLASTLGVKITGRIVSHYDAVEARRAPALVDAVREGQTVLVVTDAGMPSVSDPGYRLVVACVEAGLPVSCLPGPSAVTTALALSGLPCDRFCFEGFAPRKPGERRRWLESLAGEPRTAVFFESPRRLAATLSDAVDVLGGDRAAAVCRELTKTYEQVLRGGLGELAKWAADVEVRGEISVVLAGAVATDAPLDVLVARVRERVAGGERLKDAVHAVAEGTRVSKRELYAAALPGGG